MKWTWAVLCGCGVLAAFSVACWLDGSAEIPVSGRNGFYVWQRQWPDSVESCVLAELERGDRDLYVLCGELECEGGELRWRGTQAPKEILRNDRVTAVFRLPVKALSDAGKAASAVVARADALGASRIQLDADVPERMIGRYAELAENIRSLWTNDCARLHMGATFLPCHLWHKGIRRVLAAIDEPVIQLHGIDAPKDISESWALMNRKTVFRALRQARALDGRFKMALPSYAYVLTFNADGTFRRLYAEGLPDDYEMPRGTRRRLAAPDLKLLRDVLASPLRLPAIWFRLPVKGEDRWCLDRETVALLESGQLPVAKVEFEVRGGGREGVFDLVARYRNQVPIEGARAAIDWGADGEGEFFALNGSVAEDGSPYGRLPRKVRMAPFACGEEFVFGKAIMRNGAHEISIHEIRD